MASRQGQAIVNKPSRNQGSSMPSHTNRIISSKDNLKLQSKDAGSNPNQTNHALSKPIQPKLKLKATQTNSATQGLEFVFVVFTKCWDSGTS
ncbi:hypothetical protein COLO4_05061 [Corchorus olitorius]|uniref:Uncharacterized protein n=1 Tax=Corchorus olitorius TaxID=93759 RepID=A0A1R3KS31_9ROSI|nr:hypothetical protein COLO4_05061 [Corchorus olitorius]